jgi:hypothetical protein
MYAIYHSPYHKAMDFSFAEKKNFNATAGYAANP